VNDLVNNKDKNADEAKKIEEAEELLNQQIDKILNLLNSPQVLDKIFNNLDETQANSFYTEIRSVAIERGNLELVNNLDLTFK
jgi:CRISPR/Cas system CSM-associated protein Csm2 small subunit